MPSLHLALSVAALAIGFFASHARAKSLFVVNTRPSEAFVHEVDLTGGTISTFIPFAKTKSANWGDPDDLVYTVAGDALLVSFGRLYDDPATGVAGSIRKFSLSGKYLGRFDIGYGSQSRMCRPYGMAFAPNGNLYVASFGSDEIFVFSPTGKFLKVFASGLNGPDTLLFIGDRLYITEEGSSANGDCTVGFPDGQFSRVVVFRDYTNPHSKTVFTTPEAFPDKFFVSLLGLGRADGELFVSDFAGGVRSYSLNVALPAPVENKYISPSPFIFGDLDLDPKTDDVYTVYWDATTLATSVLKLSDDLDKPEVIVGPASEIQRAIGVLFKK